MQKSQSPSWFSQSILGLVAVISFASRASATTTITNAAGASVFDNSTPSLYVVYGGTAGVGSASQITNADGTVDTCNRPPYPHFACNKRAIVSTGNLTIFVQNSTDGYTPTITYTSGGSSTTITPDGGTTTGSKSQPGSITLSWTQVCQIMSTAQSAAPIGANCDTASSASALVAFKVGVAAAPTATTPAGSITDAVDMNIVVTKFVGQDLNPATYTGVSEAGQCGAGISGVCSFEVAPGDQKVVMKALEGDNGFPNTTPQNIKKVRLLWAKGSGTFTQIQADSPFRDLDLKNIDLTKHSAEVVPGRIDGFENDTFYSFKVASVDAAGNTGYYTANADDGYCTRTNRPTSTDCHIAQPGEVVGILSDNSCFVATAAFGSPMAPQVQVFREFRNQFLATSKWGVKLVKFYYAHSPKYADIIARNETLRSVARAVLWPVLGIVWVALHAGGWAAFALLAALVIFPFWMAAKRKRSARA